MGELAKEVEDLVGEMLLQAPVMVSHDDITLYYNKVMALIQQERQKAAREALEGLRPKLLEDVDEGDYYYGGTRRIDDIEGLIDEALKEHTDAA